MAAKKRKIKSSNGSERKSTASERRANKTIERGAINKEERTSELHKLTIYGVGILVLAIVAGLALNKKSTATIDNVSVDVSFGVFWNKACSSSGVWCGDGKVEPTRRTLQANSMTKTPISHGDVVAEIPRELQLWEIDALRSDFVKNEKLLKARHKMTKNPLASGAFLATHLVNERKRLLGNENVEKVQANDSDGSPAVHGGKIEELHASYLDSLPSWEELSRHHPLLASRTDLQSMLGHHSWNFAVVIMYQEMIHSEYEALVAASPLVFGKKISLKDYQTARIHVLSRSFNPGPKACSTEAGKYFSTVDLDRLMSDWGIQSNKSIFDEGCHAMVPILDMLNSHPIPNVVYDYHLEKQAFVISAKSSISPGWELINSYGKFSDAHLFAKFGFVNGDGSGYTQASIAVFHRPLDIQISQEFTLVPNKISFDGNELPPMERIPDFQKINMKRYLMYDDGYDTCVQKELHPEAFRLKRLKWLHLAKIANDPKYWVVTLRPRAPKSRPRISSDLLIAKAPPEFNPKNVRMDMTHLVDTCRLLALTIDDLGGNAIKILEENLGNNTFVVPKGSESLEYRSLMFLVRLSSTALMQYSVNLKDEYHNVLKLNEENAFVSSTTTWNAAQLRLGEMQSLHSVSGIAMTYARGILKDSDKKETLLGYKIREKACPPHYTDIIDE